MDTRCIEYAKFGKIPPTGGRNALHTPTCTGWIFSGKALNQWVLGSSPWLFMLLHSIIFLLLSLSILCFTPLLRRNFGSEVKQSALAAHSPLNGPHPILTSIPGFRQPIVSNRSVARSYHLVPYKPTGFRQWRRLTAMIVIRGEYAK